MSAPSPEPRPDRHLSTHIVARRLGVTVRHVQRLIGAGALEAVDISYPGSNRPTYRIPERALEDFAAARRGELLRL